jgi:hypothetical protein
MNKPGACAAAAAILAALPGWGTARAEPLTAEQAIEAYRETFEPVSALDCPKPSDEEEIIVCGRRPGQADPNRLPIVPPRAAGARIPGEPATMAGFSCLHSCPQPLKLDLIKTAKVGRKIIRHILDPD